MKNLNTRQAPLLAISEHSIRRIEERCATLLVGCKTIPQLRRKISNLVNYRSDKSEYKLGNGVIVIVKNKTIITVY